MAAADGGAMLRAAIAEFHFRTHGDQQFAFGLDIPYLGHVLENDFVFGKDGCSHAGKRGVFCAADANRSQQWLSSSNDKLVHAGKHSLGRHAMSHRESPQSTDRDHA